VIVLDMDQGSFAWKAARLGIPTASNFARILTPKTRKPSASQAGYRCQLLSDWLLGRPSDAAAPTGFMARGTELEQEARAYLEFQRGVTVERVGFVLRDDLAVGGSPDGLIGDDAGAEIKCLSAPKHVAALLGEDGDEHFAQVQGYLWLTGRARWYLVHYNPELPSAIRVVERDEEYIDALAAEINRFTERLAVGREALLALGCVPREPVTDAVLETEVSAEAEAAATAMPF
jgi:hypothetical protein